MLMYEILFSEAVEEELAEVRPYDRVRILDSIDEQLLHEPALRTRNRKMMAHFIPEFEADPPVWELRVGDYRVFYDVDAGEGKVYVRAVRHKPPHRTTKEAL
jgi:mRNA-degrading endonuclease RelE of RelBE toxin-antitoxin system